MSDALTSSKLSRRELFLQTAIVSCAVAAEEAPLNAAAGVDRVTVRPGKTYLRGWAGYGDPPAPTPWSGASAHRRRPQFRAGPRRP